MQRRRIIPINDSSLDFENDHDDTLTIEEQNEETTLVLSTKRDSSLFGSKSKQETRYSNICKTTSVSQTPYGRIEDDISVSN